MNRSCWVLVCLLRVLVRVVLVRVWWVGWWLVGVGVGGVGRVRSLLENCIVDASIFVSVVKFLRAHGGCLGTRSR